MRRLLPAFVAATAIAATAQGQPPQDVLKVLVAEGSRAAVAIHWDA
jgi:hypothetical protein